MEHDGAEHARLRRLVGAGFSRKVDRGLRGLGAGTCRPGARPRPRTRRAGLRGGGLARTPHPDALPHPGGAGRGRRRPRGVGRRADLERGPRVLDGGHRPGGHRGVPPAAVPEPGGPGRLRLREPDPERTSPPSHRRHHLRDAGRGCRRPAAHRAGVPELLPAPHRGRQRDHPPHHLSRSAGAPRTSRRLRRPRQRPRRARSLRVGHRGDPPLDLGDHALPAHPHARPRPRRRARCAGATRPSSGTSPRTATRRRSRSPSGSTSAGARTRTWPSAPAGTSASGPGSRASRSGSPSRNSSAGCAPWNSPARPTASVPTSSTGSSTCRCV